MEKRMYDVGLSRALSPFMRDLVLVQEDGKVSWGQTGAGPGIESDED